VKINDRETVPVLNAKFVDWQLPESAWLNLRIYPAYMIPGLYHVKIIPGITRFHVRIQAIPLS
jgi:hypothetical protein